MMGMSAADYINIALAGGLLGTGAMTLLLTVINKSGLTHCDMLRAVGSLKTKSYDNALVPGVIIHFCVGIVFAVLYGLAIERLNLATYSATVAFCTAMGLFHGGIVGLLLVVTVAERHPLPEFQKAGFGVAAAHWIAHIVYGLVVGMVIGAIVF